MQLTLTDFKKIELDGGVYYLSAKILHPKVGGYEITIEPHLSAGYTIAIYDLRDPLLSIKKQCVWKYNHPQNRTSRRTEEELINRALDTAEYLYNYYALGDKEAVNPTKSNYVS